MQEKAHHPQDNTIYGSPINDEWFEKNEKTLMLRKQELGRQIGALSTGWLKNWPSRRQKRGQLCGELAFTVASLAEIREIRRAILGLSFNAHLRGRAMPNFVAANPSYALAVGDELPEAAAIAQAAGLQEKST